MGSEQSQQPNAIRVNPNTHDSSRNSRLTRGNTISAIGHSRANDGSQPFLPTDTRPVSPPISVCSDSDLPYISYTDKPIGDSPKLRSKAPTTTRNFRLNESSRKASVDMKRKTYAHNIVVVRPAAKDDGVEKDNEILKLQKIPQFLPVMRGTLSLPANRDPEVLERLQPSHLTNICSRLQIHLNTNSAKVFSEQNLLSSRIKEIDADTTKLLLYLTEKQKLYSTYAEIFSKVRNISQQLSRCNTLLNQNMESMETINSLLDVENRLEPFVWKTS